MFLLIASDSKGTLTGADCWNSFRGCGGRLGTIKRADEEDECEEDNEARDAAGEGETDADEALWLNTDRVSDFDSTGKAARIPC